MKRATLISALVFAGIPSLMAQEKINLIVNGDFEDSNYSVFSYDNESVTNCPNTIAGWDLIDDSTRFEDYNNVGLNKYNVRATMGKYDPADNDNYQYIRVQRYEWSKSSDGPGDGYIQQTVDVAPSTTYTFSFLYRLSSHSENSTIVPAWFSIQEDENTPIRKKFYNELNENWYSKEQAFTTSDTAKQVRVRLGVTGGFIYSWGGNIDLWADFDNVNLFANTTTSIEESVSQVQIKADVNDFRVNLSGLAEGENVVVYDITGKKISSFTSQSESATITLPYKGLFIVRNGLQRAPLKLVIK
ncbi:MAG: hypothetical protein PHV66_01775 [Bacteroidales bacterium]|nr:hypothetical protein [Bacteroidales bacterium]